MKIRWGGMKGPEVIGAGSRGTTEAESPIISWAAAVILTMRRKWEEGLEVE